MELKNRKNIIEWMNKNNVREFKEVAQIVSQYIENNEETLKLIKEDDK
jgi:N-acetylglucosamine kinase-like BadF-type ATPase